MDGILDVAKATEEERAYKRKSTREVLLGCLVFVLLYAGIVGAVVNIFLGKTWLWWAAPIVGLVPLTISTCCVVGWDRIGEKISSLLSQAGTRLRTTRNPS